MGRRRVWLVSGVVALALGGGLWGCKEPAERLADHFESMAMLVESNAEDCGAMGAALGAYWEAHRAEMVAAMGELGASTDVQAKRINRAALRIDAPVERCRSEAQVAAFAEDLAAVVLDGVGLGPGQ